MKEYAEARNFPHLLLHGPPGTGKTISAERLARAVDSEWKIWSSTESRKLTIIQDQVAGFARTKSIDKSFKVAIIDECDRFDKEAQNSLRGPMASPTSPCRFILVSNVPGDINDWVRSRCFLLRYYPVSPDDIYERLALIAEDQHLENVITTEQLFRIAEISLGDVRTSIKRLQGLCQNRKTHVADDELESTAGDKDIATIGRSISLAFDGDWTGAVGALNELIYGGWKAEKILETIIQELPKSKFTEEQKIVIGLSMQKIDYLQYSTKFQLYGMLAFIAANGGTDASRRKTYTSY